jgi:hypothetical protein
MYMRKHKDGLVYLSFISFIHIICFISVAVHMNKFLTNSEFVVSIWQEIFLASSSLHALLKYFASLEITRSTMPIAGVHRFVVADIIEKLGLKQQ